jgi:phosphoglycolate phosphatase
MVRIPQPPVALLMDFDGVILDSMELKTQGFVTVYEGEPPSKLAQVLAHQRLHGGVTRRAKFAYFEQHVFGRAGDNETIEHLASAYRDLIYAAVLACPFVRGAEEFLRRAQGQIGLHVISGTPQEELLEIIERRGLTSYFHTIAGAPMTKRAAFEAILNENDLIAAETVAIGDATTEYLAADELGIPFIGVVPDGMPNPFPPGVPTLRSLEELPAILGVQ